MLHSLVSSIFPSRVSEKRQDDEAAKENAAYTQLSPTSQPTAMSKNNTQRSPKPPCHGVLFLIYEGTVKQLLTELFITFEGTSVTIHGSDPESKRSRMIPLDVSKIFHLRWHNPRMVQLGYRINEVVFIEYGILCEQEDVTSWIYEKLLEALCLTCNLIQLPRNNVSVQFYDEEKEIFEEIDSNAMLNMYKRDDDNLLLLLVKTAEKEMASATDQDFSALQAAVENLQVTTPENKLQPTINNTSKAMDAQRVIFHIIVQDGTSYLPNECDLTLSFWVPENKIDAINLYAVHFTHSEQFRIIMSHLTALETDSFADNSRYASYSSSDDDSDKEDLVWSESEEAENISPEMRNNIQKISKTGNSKWKRSHTSNDRTNRFVEAGVSHAFVFRDIQTDKSLLKNVEVGVLRLGDGLEGDEQTIGHSNFVYDGIKMDPRSALLFNGDDRLLMTDVKNQNSVFMMDTNSGKIVQKWEDPNLEISSLMNAFKDQWEIGGSEVLGYNPRALFKLDTRIPSKIDGPRFVYTDPPRFTCGATNKEGHIVMGSEKLGAVRLYDGKANQSGNFKRAKLLIRGEGDPLVHVSVTSDGSWILGTCRHYLILYLVDKMRGGRSNISSTLQPKRQLTIKLEVRDDDLRSHGVDVENFSFSKAEFDAEEKFIIAIAKQAVISWKFQEVKDGKRDYRIRRWDENIADMGIAGDKANQLLIMATETTVQSARVPKIGEKTQIIKPK